MKKKHKSHKQEEKEAIESGLKAIYGDDQVDFTTLERAPSRLTHILLTVIVTLAVLGIGAGIAFFVYQNYFDIRQENFLALTIDAPEAAISGELAMIEIHYQNTDAVAITNLELDARLPYGFEIQSMSPAPDDADELIWQIGTMPGNSDATITIEGLWLAEAPSESPIQMLATYRPGNFNSDFTDIETVHIDTLDSTLEMHFEGPDETYPGEEQEYTMTILNDGQQDYDNLLTVVDLPDGFFLSSSNPPIETGGTPEWPIEFLKAGEEQEISFIGSFASDQEGFAYFNAQTYLERDPVNLEQVALENFVDVLQNDIRLQLVASGQTGDVSTSLNEDLRFTLSLENTGETTVEDITLLLDFQSQDPLPILWSEAQLDGGIIRSDGIHLSQDIIGPGEQALFNLTFPIDSAVGSGQADFFEVIASAELGDRSIKSSPISVNISSDAQFSASMRYHDTAGGILGNGPLPPVAGQTTTYQLFWTIENQLHGLEDVEISATLAPGATWENQYNVDIGVLSYDNNSRTVTWNFSELPLSLPRVEASTAISITPSNSDLGSFVKLISGSTFSAVDSETGETLTRVTTSLSTDLIDDVFAEEKGAVVE